VIVIIVVAKLEIVYNYIMLCYYCVNFLIFKLRIRIRMTSHIDILVTVIQLCVIEKGIEGSETITSYILTL